MNYFKLCVSVQFSLVYARVDPPRERLCPFTTSFRARVATPRRVDRAPVAVTSRARDYLSVRHARRRRRARGGAKG